MKTMAKPEIDSDSVKGCDDSALRLVDGEIDTDSLPEELRPLIMRGWFCPSNDAY